jgi:hypothetical protein
LDKLQQHNTLFFYFKKAFQLFGEIDFNGIFAACFTGCSVARLSRLLWEQEAAGSNPATPTKTFLFSRGFFYCQKLLSYNKN